MNPTPPPEDTSSPEISPTPECSPDVSAEVQPQVPKDVSLDLSQPSPAQQESKAEEKGDANGRAARADDSDKPTVLETIRALRANTVAGKNLSASDRRACVEHLAGEGCSRADIAEILKVSERTVARDRKAIQESHALEQDPRLVPQLVGKLVEEADRCITRIRRACRDKEADPAVRIDAEHRCYQIISDVTELLRKIGYLPTAAQRVEARMWHEFDDLPHLNDLQREFERLSLIAPKSGNGEITTQFAEIQQVFAQANLSGKVAALSAALVKEDADASPS